jgi:hypothetical protein
MPPILEILCAPDVGKADKFAEARGWEPAFGQTYWRHGRGGSLTIVKVVAAPSELAAMPGPSKVHMHFPEGVPAEWAAALAKRNPSPSPFNPMETAPIDRPIRVYDAKRHAWQTCQWEQRTRDFGAWFIVGTGAWISHPACWMECEDAPPEDIIAAALPPKDAA